METKSRQKEVFFGKYCSKCLDKDKKEDEEPCETCLGAPSNTDSHRPIRFRMDPRTRQLDN